MAEERETGLFGLKIRPVQTQEELDALLNPELENSVKTPAEKSLTPIQQYTFEGVLIKIGEKYFPKHKLFTTQELKSKLLGLGERKLKQKVGMGFFNRKITKSLDELADGLYELGGVSSVKEGRQIIPLIVNTKVDIGMKVLNCKYLIIEEITNLSGQKSYQIREDCYL